MLTNIAMIVLAIAILIAVTVVFVISHKYGSSELDRSDYSSSRILNDKIDRLENKIQPIIDKREHQLKEDSWRQYNEWKFCIEAQYFRKKDESINYGCAKCMGVDLEINTEYKEYYSDEHDWKRKFFNEPDIKYPLKANLKCNSCGHVEK